MMWIGATEQKQQQSPRRFLLHLEIQIVRGEVLDQCDGGDDVV